MDREQIRQLIQRENLERSTNVLARQLVRVFNKLCELDEKLKNSGGRPEELDRLEAENRDLEQAIEQRNEELLEVGKEKEFARASHQNALAISAQRRRELEGNIEKQRDESMQLRAKLKQLENKPAEKERLRRRRDEVQAEGEQLQTKINNLGEEYQKNSDLLQSLKPFVERVEMLEKQMEETMGQIWNGIKPDAFDRMF